MEVPQKGDTTILSPKKIKRFIINETESNGERKVFDNILEAFYCLEFGQNDNIRFYAKYTYDKITNNGPVYYTVQKKYCLYKNSVPYFPRPEALKADLLILTADCSKVVKKLRNQKVKMDDLTSLITEYNHCGK